MMILYRHFKKNSSKFFFNLLSHISSTDPFFKKLDQMNYLSTSKTLTMAYSHAT